MRTPKEGHDPKKIVREASGAACEMMICPTDLSSLADASRFRLYTAQQVR
jgi:hypothetical protein